MIRLLLRCRENQQKDRCVRPRGHCGAAARTHRDGSTLRELDRPARAALSVFLAFLHPAVASEKAVRAERRLEGNIVDFERARDAEDDRARLARRAAALDEA